MRNQDVVEPAQFYMHRLSPGPQIPMVHVVFVLPIDDSMRSPSVARVRYPDWTITSTIWKISTCAQHLTRSRGIGKFRYKRRTVKRQLLHASQFIIALSECPSAISQCICGINVPSTFQRTLHVLPSGYECETCLVYY